MFTFLLISSLINIHFKRTESERKREREWEKSLRWMNSIRKLLSQVECISSCRSLFFLLVAQKKFFSEITISGEWTNNFFHTISIFFILIDSMQLTDNCEIFGPTYLGLIEIGTLLFHLSSKCSWLGHSIRLPGGKMDGNSNGC